MCYDVNDKEFIKSVHAAGLVIPKSEHTLWLLTGYKKKLETIWKECKSMEQVKVTYRDETKVMEIPLTIKGSLWHWVCEKPVANQNPYMKLFSKIKELFPELDQEKITLRLPSESSPHNFDKRTTYNDNWVKEMETLEPDEIIVMDGRDVEEVLSYMERIKNVYNK